MPSPALSTFLPILAIVIAMIVWWRVMVIIVVAFVIAVLAIGAQEVVDRIEQLSARGTVTGPAADGSLPVP